MADSTVDLRDEFQHAYIGLGLLVSSRVLYILDYLDTLEAEVTYIWWEPGKLGKFLFLLSRYTSLVLSPFFIYLKAANANGITSAKVPLSPSAHDFAAH
ncbi:hypothetical protein H1R20_g7587, partial [Candolleomyces eurysporus]